MAKFAEYPPLYRQSEIYARQGVELSRNTMGRWVDIMGEQLRPLYDELNHYVLMPGKVPPHRDIWRTQADAYAGYNVLYFIAHTRRKIHDVHVHHPTTATTEALCRIGALYAIESEIRGSPADERLAARKARSVPLIQSLYDWIQQQMSGSSNG